MITIKKPEEIKIIREGGKILADILDQVVQKVEAGVTTAELDEFAEKSIIEKGGIPSFKNYRASQGEVAFPTTLCTSVND